MDWTDTGMVLARRRHGESGAIVALFTRERGRHLGRVRSLSGRRAGGVYEIGNLVRAHWRARLDEHLGNYDGELAVAHAARVLDDPDRLAALTAAMTVIDQATPEREPHAVLYDATLELLAELGRDDWPQRYVRWECACLTELGFGLSLEECAVTGAAEGLTHVSPRTGRAVSAAAAGPYADRLLTLPGFINDPALAATRAELLDGLALTGHFIERHVLAPLGHRMPAARNRLVDRIRRWATMPGSAQGI